MKRIGIVRKVDKLGRIVLPVELRKTLDIGDKDDMEIAVEGDKIVLRKYDPACIFCGGLQQIGVFREKNICMNCLRELQQVSIDQ